MHNILIHSYAQVNNETVWQTATSDIGEIAVTVQALLTEIGPPHALPTST